MIQNDKIRNTFYTDYKLAQHLKGFSRTLTQ